MCRKLEKTKHGRKSVSVEEEKRAVISGPEKRLKASNAITSRMHDSIKHFCKTPHVYSNVLLAQVFLRQFWIGTRKIFKDK